MADPKNNYIPIEAWRDDSSLGPSRPACEGDEDVLASIACRHVSSLGIRQADLIPPDAPPAADEAEPPVVSEVESPLPDSTGLRETSPKGVFYVRRAICKSQGEPARGEPAGDNLARGRLARVLIVYLVSMAVLTVLAVALCFVTRLDWQSNEEFAQTGIFADEGRDSGKTEDPEAEALGRQNTVIVVDR